MGKKIKVTIDGKVKEYAEGITYEKIAQEYQDSYGGLICLVIVNGRIRELIKTLKKDCEVSFLTFSDMEGYRTYVRSTTFLLVKAINDVVGGENIKKIKVEFTIGCGYYCSGYGNFKIDKEFTDKVNAKMRELVDKSIPIVKETYPIDDAIRMFKKHGMYDKEKLLGYRRSSYVNIYSMEDYTDYYYGYMLPNTSYIKYFEVIPYHEGFVLMLPDKANPTTITAFEAREKFFGTMRATINWSNELGIDTVGDLNNQICAGKLNELILVQEALMERRIGEIAREIASRKDVKFIMIAGPSSSGKTTFSHRLSIQLRTLGISPHPIAVDDYFVNRELTPRDEKGDYNFECLEAIDTERFNKDMLNLLNGESVELPEFNFKTGQREYNGNIKKLGADDVLVIEGIHGLNDKMSYELPNESKFKVYISALASLNVDEHNRIPTTDVRLIRRMVRDARTRGASAQKTISMWPSVRRGEEENIFPFQESADALFNSTLIYELAVLKQFAEPLLFGITKTEAEYYEAKRLLKFLDYFLGVSSENLPNNSIIREFVGGSCFKV